MVKVEGMELKVGMKVRTNFNTGTERAVWEVIYIVKEQACSSGYYVSLKGIVCKCCGIKPYDLTAIDAGWITEVVEE